MRLFCIISEIRPKFAKFVYHSRIYALTEGGARLNFLTTNVLRKLK